MKFKNSLLAVENMSRTTEFYQKVLGLHVISDFGANVAMTGGISFQTLDTWSEFINKPADDIIFGSDDAEIYFEEIKFDDFVAKIEKLDGINYVHKVKEHDWGQRAVRIYDPDKHIIEIGEDMKSVYRRFAASGMTDEEIARRMDVPIKYVKFLAK